MPELSQDSPVTCYWKLSALQVVELLKIGKVTSTELIDAVEARHKETDRCINAIPIACFERARAAAKSLQIPANPGPQYLYGLPIVVKDSTPVKGVLWTNGSRIFRDRIAQETDPHIENLERNGAIVVGKSNLPEFGAGANTYNEDKKSLERYNDAWRLLWRNDSSSGDRSGVKWPTSLQKLRLGIRQHLVEPDTSESAEKNLTTQLLKCTRDCPASRPHLTLLDTYTRLAHLQVWLGTGADLGGSLRIPASFCGVVGFRSSVGLVPQRFSGLDEPIKTVSGPMARNVPDLALMLDAMTGQHPRDPESLPKPELALQEAIRQDCQLASWRVAWSADLNGTAPTEPETAEICSVAARWFASQGAEVCSACPDLSDADWIFQVLRADGFSKAFRTLRDDPLLGCLMKPELHWQIGKGESQTAKEVQAATQALAALRDRVTDFFFSFDLLCTPTVMTAPFDTSVRWPQQVGEKKYTNYVEWLLMTFAFSLVDVPAISIPCGMTREGLPVGLQIIGPHRSDARVLQAAALYERHHAWHRAVPLEPRSVPGKLHCDASRP